MDWYTLKSIIETLAEKTVTITALYFLYRLLMALISLA